MARTVTLHRGFEIVAALLGGKPTARVFRAKRLATTDDFTGSTLIEAIASAASWVDDLRGREITGRRDRGIGTVDEYSRYFATQLIADHARAMLEAHFAATDRTLSATQLAVAAGWPNYTSANLHYGMLGDQIAQYLELELPIRKDGSKVGTAALAVEGNANTEGEEHFQWKMHPEVADALVKAGIVKG